MAALKVEEWDRMIDVNIKGLLYGVAAALPIFQKQKYGHIINIASVAGFKVFAPGGAVYSATKFAVRAITEGLRLEHRGDNLRCTIVSPGAVATELAESTSEEARTAATCASFTRRPFPPSPSRARSSMPSSSRPT